MIERTNAISARISNDAYSIYRKFKEKRQGGAMVSDAILFFEQKEDFFMRDTRRTRNILALQTRLSEALKELAEITSASNPPDQE